MCSHLTMRQMHSIQVLSVAWPQFYAFSNIELVGAEENHILTTAYLAATYQASSLRPNSS